MAKIHSLCLANTSESNRSILLLILITIIFAFLFIFSKNDRSIHALACRPLVGTSTITEAHAESAWLWWYPSSCLATNAYGVLKDANDLARSRHLVLQQWPAHLLDHFWGSVIHFSSISLVAGNRNCTEVSRVCPEKTEKTREPGIVDLFYKSLNCLNTPVNENEVGVTAQMEM